MPVHSGLNHDTTGTCYIRVCLFLTKILNLYVHVHLYFRYLCILSVIFCAKKLTHILNAKKQSQGFIV